jgi:acetolactate synthase I/III small subunit
VEATAMEEDRQAAGAPSTGTGGAVRAGRTVLALTVHNHPGVMSHICGLFSRRACNVEGILCMPVGEGSSSRIWLLLNEDERLEQIIRQVRKLEDVLDVERHGADHEVFVRLETAGSAQISDSGGSTGAMGGASGITGSSRCEGRAAS